MLAGGKPLVLLHVSEFVVILGVAVGVLVIASPAHVLKEIVAQDKRRDRGQGRRQGRVLRPAEAALRALHDGPAQRPDRPGRACDGPAEQRASSSATRPCSNHPERLQFLCNGLKPVIDGKIKPDQLEHLMDAELDAKTEEADHPVHLLQMVGDSLPGIGIVAAVLGIINTMAVHRGRPGGRRRARGRGAHRHAARHLLRLRLRQPPGQPHPVQQQRRRPVHALDQDRGRRVRQGPRAADRGRDRPPLARHRRPARRAATSRRPPRRSRHAK